MTLPSTPASLQRRKHVKPEFDIDVRMPCFGVLIELKSSKVEDLRYFVDVSERLLRMAKREQPFRLEVKEEDYK